ncbi:MAG: uracil-DNA glycosylase [Rubrivivax sp.]|nr:MAG: uracil-DNA glycosylase [Rubrivivax sp.]
MGVQHFWPQAPSEPLAPSGPLPGPVQAAEALPDFVRDAQPPSDRAAPRDKAGASSIDTAGARPVSMTAPPAGRPASAPRATPLATPSTSLAGSRSTADQQALAAIGQRPAGIEQMDWDTLRQTVAGCTACGLCQGRRQTVFGVGNTSARWMLVGEAPGEQEDRQGEPFVGRSGQLLDRMLMATGLTRQEAPADQQVYIANVIKCRPPGNRNPLPEEVAQCEPYLLRQMALVQPRLILAMGRFAVQSLLRTNEPIGRLRGQVHDYHGVPLIVTYHPAYLLRNPADKALAWDDLCRARELIRQG